MDLTSGYHQIPIDKKSQDVLPQKWQKWSTYKQKNKFLRKVISTESEANTLHFLPLRSKIALAPPIFELDL